MAKEIITVKNSDPNKTYTEKYRRQREKMRQRLAQIDEARERLFPIDKIQAT